MGAIFLSIFSLVSLQEAIVVLGAIVVGILIGWGIKLPFLNALFYQRLLEEKHRSRRALAESEARFRSAFSDAAIGMAIVSLRGEFISVNKSLCYFLGYPEFELKSLTFQEITHPDDLETDLNYLNEVLANQRHKYYMEKRYFHKAGYTVWAFLSVSVVKNSAGEPLYFVSQIENINPRKESEIALHKSEQRFRAIFNQVFQFIGLLTPEGILIEANQTALDFGGITLKDVVNKPFWEAHWWQISRETKEQLKQSIKEAAQGKFIRYEFWVQGKEGKVIWIDFSLRPVKDEEGNVILLIPEGRDITERKQAEEELEKAKATAETANRAKTAFLANISHEFKTPLHSILGFTQLLNDSNLNETERNYLQTIQHSGQHLLELINDVLDLSKIEIGNFSYRENTFDLFRLLATVEAMFKGEAQRKGLDLIGQFPSDLPRYISTDRMKLNQVLINLLSNAIKYTFQGNVTLSVEVVGYTTANKAEILVSVKDTGIGISPENIEAIFKPFVRCEPSQILTSGTGLGLSITQKYLELLGGELTVVSELEKGSNFSFQIPVEVSNVNPELSSEEQPVSKTDNEERKSYRILIVDDNATNRKLLTKFVSRFGFSTQAAKQGEEAIEIWVKWQPHLIFMDIQMPILDGYEATRIIKQTAQGKETKIIAVTANHSLEKEANFESDDWTDVIYKPFNSDLILQKIEQHLEINASQIETVTQTESNYFLSEDEKIQLLSEMSASWRENLENLILDLNQVELENTIATMDNCDPRLTKLLEHYLNNFDYDTILELLRKCKS